MKSTVKTERFTATILAGHREPAFEIPFDPAERWDSKAGLIHPGRRGHAVEGTINGTEFTSVAVARSKRFFVLVTDEMRETSGVTVGDAVRITLRPAAVAPAAATKPAKGLTARQHDAAIERVRRICLAFPDTFEKLSHGEPTWFAGGRVFTMLDDHHHGADRLAVWCPAPQGAQRDVVTADPGNFFIPPYVGKSGWIGVRIDRNLGWPAITAIIHEAHRLMISKTRRR